MWDKLKSTDRGTLAVGSIICSIVFFIALNAFSSVLFTSARLDLTEDGLFTLSAGTKQVLTEIDEPIDLRLYYSKSLDEIGPQISRHAIRVRELLEEFAKLSGGMVRVEYFDPRPFSTEEDLAVGDDVQGLPLDQSGAQVYFGLAGTNSTDDVDAVGYLAPERASFLEYDLTRLVNNLANPEKAAVGLLTDLPVQGTRQDEFQPWLILEALRQFFDVRIYDRDEAELDDDLELLVIAQPHAVNDRMMYSIDQFALNGGKVLAFLDPLAETMALAGPFAGQLPPPGVAIAGMRPLLEQWGVEMPMATFVGDANAAQRVAAPGPQGRQVAVDFLSWLVFQGDHFNREDPVSAQLQRIVLNSAGSVSQRDGATTSFEPLIWSSKVAQRIDVFKLAQRPDPVQIAKDFQSEGKSFTIAARVIGPITTAYPDGPPQAVLDAIEDAAASDALKAAHLAESKTPFNMIIVTDADMLADNNWVQSQDLLGRQLTVPIANNADFAINALDNLHGSAAVVGPARPRPVGAPVRCDRANGAGRRTAVPREGTATAGGDRGNQRHHQPYPGRRSGCRRRANEPATG